MGSTRTYHMLSAVDAVKLNFDNFLESRESVRYSNNDEFFIVKNEGALGNKLANTVPLLSGQTLSQILTALNNQTWQYDFEYNYPNVPKDGLVAFFNFDNSLTASDFGNIQLQPTGNGGIYTYGVSYSGVSFEAAGDRLIYPYNLWNQQESPTSFTAAFWVRRDVPYIVDPPQLAVMCGSVFGPMSFAFSEAGLISTGRALSFFINLTGGHYQSVGCDLLGVTLNTGIWTHLAGTLDTNARVIKLYVNGKLAITNSYVDTKRPGVAYINGSPSHTNWNGFALNGSVLESGAEYGNKYKFDNFGLWTRALNAAEISSLHNHGYGAFYQ